MRHEFYSWFENFLLEKMVATSLQGACYAVISPGTSDHIRGFGFRTLADRQPVTPNTLFGIGSVTKLVTAVAIMQLHERGLLGLDDPVERYVDVPFRADDGPIRLWHLLSHSSGIPALGLSESKMSDRSFMTGVPVADVHDLLTFMHGAERWVHAPPGQRWFYFNEGYILLGAIIEQVAGVPYGSYVAEQIFQPLGMTRSHFNREAVEREADRATPYMRDRAGTLFVGSNLYSQIPAAGGLVSTAQDMARFVGLFLNEGRAPGGNTIINRESLDAMMAPRVPLPHRPDPALAGPSPGETGYHALGPQVYPGFFGATLIGHGGGVMGGTSYLGCIPARGIGVVLLANGHGYPMSQLAMCLLAGLLGEDPEQLPFMRRDHLLDGFAGSYTSFRSTIEAMVLRRDDLLELRIHFHHEDRVMPLFPVSVREDSARFVTSSGGRLLDVEFQRSGGAVTLVYERYKFQKHDY